MDVWVTCVATEAEVDKGCLLGKSMRRSRTGMKLLVLVGPQISSESRAKLCSIFDLLLPSVGLVDVRLELLRVGGSLFRKLVFLDASCMLVVNNSDDIFDSVTSPLGFPRWDHAGGECNHESSIFAVNRDKLTPSLVSSLECSGVGKWIEKVKFEDELISILGPEYNVRVESDGDHHRLGDAAVRIANFAPGCHPLDLKHWFAIPSEFFAVEDFRFQRPQEEPIAVVGVSCRFPGGNTPEELWDLLLSGKEGIKPVPDHRWTAEQTRGKCCDRNIECGFLDCSVDEMDETFFGWSATESEYLDPQQVLLHEVAWEALEDAGQDPTELAGTQTGIFMGTWVHHFSSICASIPDRDCLRSYLGNSVATTSARLSHFLGTTGPSTGYEVGCASTMAALHAAVLSLRRRETQLAIVGGANILLDPSATKDFKVLVAKDGRCKTFDAAADGFGRAEGVAVLVLKRLSDATRDKDRVWGLIRGTAIVQEGASKSLGTPTVSTEALAMTLALESSGVLAKEVDVVEAHGTGTRVGDPIEVAAIRKAYFSTERTKPLNISSVKANIGHTEAVSGLAGVIKVLLSMREETIPPHRNLVNLNPDIDLDSIPASIPLQPAPWRRGERRRFAGVSSFGISGADGHAIIEEPPLRLAPLVPLSRINDRPLHILKLSAKGEAALEDVLKLYATTLEQQSELHFADVAFSANTGRADFSHRAVVIAGTSVEALTLIRAKTMSKGEVGQNMSVSPICFLFTGQGSQYVGMARELYSTSPVFQFHFNRCDKILTESYNLSLKPVLWECHDDSRLHQTRFSQTTIFCVEYCLLRLWESWGVKPDYVLGHSLGEFCAAVAASALTLQDALMLVAERSRLIDALPVGKMLALKAPQSEVTRHLQLFQNENPEFWLDFAALNSPDQVVLAGDSGNVDAFAKYCGSTDLRTVVLASNHAFHSRHMIPILEEYRKIASRVAPPTFGNCLAPVYISGMEGKVVDVSELNADYWMRHTVQPVRFGAACETVAKEAGCRLFLEVGPHPILSALTRTTIEDALCYPSLRRDSEDWRTLLDTLSQLYLSPVWCGVVNWKGMDAPYSSLRTRVSLPKYPFQRRKRAWPQLALRLAKFHPLLGRPQPGPLEGCSAFTSELTVRTAPFLADHVISSMLVFPGVGFLEMCLLGGYAASLDLLSTAFTCRPPTRPIFVTDLRIHKPLALRNPSTFATVHTLVTAETGAFSVSISSLQEEVINHESEGRTWVNHAQARFFSARPIMKEPPNLPNFSTWSPSVSMTPNYDKVSACGLYYGPSLRRLSTAWIKRTRDEGVFHLNLTPEDIEGGFFFHPVVADTMLQTLLMLKAEGQELKKLLLPVRIGQFALLQPRWTDGISAGGNPFIIHAIFDESGKGEITLCTESDRSLIAHMVGVEVVETTVKLVAEKVENQTVALAQTWREIWVGQGSDEKALLLPSFTQAHSEDPDGAETKSSTTDVLPVPQELERMMGSWNQRSGMVMLSALLRLGWTPTISRVTVKELMKSLKIRSNFTEYLTHWLDLFSAAPFNWMSREEGSSQIFYTPLKSLPNLDEVEARLTDPLQGASRAEARMVVEVGEGLESVLSGKLDPLALVFPTNPRSTKVEEVYTEALARNREWLEEGVKSVIRRVQASRHQQTEGKVLRVLEVGAGTGTFTKLILDVCEKYLIDDVEYHFTDVSVVFLDPAAAFSQKSHSNKRSGWRMVYNKFDMNNDPLNQGYAPHSFDLIVGFCVLHVATVVEDTLSNLRALLKRDAGCLAFFENAWMSPRLLLTFGLLDDFWNYADSETRTGGGPLLSVESWEKSLRSTGFEMVARSGTQGDEDVLFVAKVSQIDKEGSGRQVSLSQYSWLVLDASPTSSDFGAKLARKLESANRRVHTAPWTVPVTSSRADEIENENDETRTLTHFFGAIRGAQRGGSILEGIVYICESIESWSQVPENQRQASLPLLTLCQAVARMENPLKLVVLTRGAAVIGEVAGNVNPKDGPVNAIVRTLWNEKVQFLVRHLDLEPFGFSDGKHFFDDEVNKVFGDLWMNSNEQLAYRQGRRLSPQLVSAPIQNWQPLTLPKGVDRFHLLLPVSKMVRDLEFVALDACSALENEEVEIKVVAVALNFRDVLTVIKPNAYFEEASTFGLDVSGIVTRLGAGVTRWQVGDRVVGTNNQPNSAFRSHLNLQESSLVSLPQGWTMWEGSTLPTVFYTAFHCLISLAKMHRGETVLIHTASGGVGLCAIQLCHLAGVHVIATAGTDRKRAYLRTQLGIDHVFSSRTTEFASEILRVTDGRGVDIVLNSLTGPGFKEASLEALKTKGRFIEMSKLNIWSETEVFGLRPDVAYAAVDLTELSPHQRLLLTDALSEHLENNLLRPIPLERWDALNIRGALAHLQKAAHIGKVVCVMPEVKPKQNGGGLTVATPLFNEDSTYLVTGGLTGIGPVVVRMILANGGKHVVIAARRQHVPQEVAQQMAGWREAGAHIQHSRVDVGDKEALSHLIAQLRAPNSEWPPLRGVFHLAGVLSDGTLENQNWAKFEIPYRPKIDGSWWLHQLLSEIDSSSSPPMEYFVMFSSMISHFACKGQMNHAAANRFQDVLSAHRHSLGLPSTAINWGPWGEVGVAVNVDIAGHRPMSTSQGEHTLIVLLRTHSSHVVVSNVSSFPQMETHSPFIRTYVESKHWNEGELVSPTHRVHQLINSDDFWKEYDSATNPQEREASLLRLVERTLAVILRLEQAAFTNSFQPDLDFATQGADSLVMLEFKNSLQKGLGSRFTLTQAHLRDVTTPRILASRLSSVLPQTQTSQ